VEEFEAGIKGQKVTSVSRRGKHLIWHLSNGKCLIMHFRMTGSLLFNHLPGDSQKFIRATIVLDDGRAIEFRDPRSFGVMWLVSNPQEVTAKLGPEPLQKEFTTELLGSILTKRKAPIKALLLEQDLIAGIGNMYADEALFVAHIHPMRKGNTLTTAEIKRLHKAIEQVLTMGIQNKGASIESYYRPMGDIGTAHFSFKAAHRGGEPCPNGCGGKIERIVVRGRGTYFCPNCQKP